MGCFCPNCGNDFEGEVCDKCGFDFNDILDCPRRISLRCVHTHQECKVHGLDYEDCPIFLTKSGIIPKSNK